VISDIDDHAPSRQKQSVQRNAVNDTHSMTVIFVAPA